MAKLIPGEIPENNWKKLDANKAYAFRSAAQDIRIRFGAGGLFIAISQSSSGERIINSIGLEDGTYTVIGKLNQNATAEMGRAKDSTIPVSHSIVSRKHLEFYLDGDILVIKDLGSTNGTFCHTENFHFEIDSYLNRRPPETAPTSTMDEVHEAFGTTIDDFLKKYSEKNKKDS